MFIYSTPHTTLRHSNSPRPRDNRLYVTDYTQRPQQVIGLGHQTQAFIQMPLIFMNGDVIRTCKQMISEEPSFSVMLRYKYTRNEESFHVKPDLLTSILRWYFFYKNEMKLCCFRPPFSVIPS